MLAADLKFIGPAFVPARQWMLAFQLDQAFAHPTPKVFWRDPKTPTLTLNARGSFAGHETLFPQIGPCGNLSTLRARCKTGGNLPMTRPDVNENADGFSDSKMIYYLTTY